jgi:hypothetical protein
MLFDFSIGEENHSLYCTTHQYTFLGLLQTKSCEECKGL